MTCTWHLQSSRLVATMSMVSSSATSILPNAACNIKFYQFGWNHLVSTTELQTSSDLQRAIPLLLKSKPPKPSSRLKTIWSIIIDSNKSPHCFHGATLRRKELDGTQVHCHWAQILPWTQKWRWDQIMNSMQRLLKHVETGTRPSDQLNVGQMYKTWTLVLFLPIGSGTAPDDKHWLIRAYRLTLDR